MTAEVIEPARPETLGPRAPTQDEWDAMTPAQQQRAVDALPAWVPPEESGAMEVDRHNKVCGSVRSALEAYFAAPVLSTRAMSRFTVEIEGMSCDGCVGSVRRALERAAGIEAEEVVIGRAVVRADATVTEAVVRKAIEDAGFDVRGVTANT